MKNKNFISNMSIKDFITPDILGHIFSFDNTHRENFQLVLNELVWKKKKRILLSFLNKDSSVLQPENPNEVFFDIWDQQNKVQSRFSVLDETKEEELIQPLYLILNICPECVPNGFFETSSATETENIPSALLAWSKQNRSFEELMEYIFTRLFFHEEGYLIGQIL